MKEIQSNLIFRFSKKFKITEIKTSGTLLQIPEKSPVLKLIPLSTGTLGVQKGLAVPKSYPSGEILQNRKTINAYNDQ